VDAADPRVDYLLIDNLFQEGNSLGVIDYCKSLKCDINKVLALWFEAALPDGLMVDNFYFDDWSFTASVDTVEFQFAQDTYKIPGSSKTIKARSNFCHLLGTDIVEKRVRCKNFKGVGRIIHFSYGNNPRDTFMTISLDYWEEIL
jgi:hypothetical protein